MKWWFAFLITALLGFGIWAYLSSPIDLAAILKLDKQELSGQRDGVKSSAAKSVPRDLLLEELRQRHQLRPLTAQEAGKPVQELPKGIYGFSACSDVLDAKRGEKFSLEIQKRRDGIVYYVGYASDEDIGKYLARQKNFHILAFPHSRERAPTLFEIPIDFVLKCEVRHPNDGDLFDLFVRDIPELQS